MTAPPDEGTHRPNGLAPHPSTGDGPYEFAGFFACRVALFSLEELAAFLEPGAAERPRWLDDPLFLEGLRVASPTVFHQAEQWRTAGARPSVAAEHALVRYLVRAGTRATPFGLFGAWCVGHGSGPAQLELRPRPCATRSTRLDAVALEGLVASLRRGWSTSMQNSYRRNPTIYTVAGRIFCFTSPAEGRDEGYQLSSVREHALVSGLLGACGEFRSRQELVEAVQALDAEVLAEDVVELVEELAGAGFLQDRLEPPLTSTHPLDDLVAVLEACGVEGEPLSNLLRVRDALRGLDLQLVPTASAHEELEDALGRSAVGPLERAALHVDVMRPARLATLSPSVVHEMCSAVEALRRLGAPRSPGLEAFQERFVARFGDVEVPLLLAVDEEYGAGFDGAHRAELLHPLTRGLAEGQSAASIGWGGRERLLLRKLEEADRAGDIAIRIEDTELEAGGAVGPLPPAFAFHGALLATAEEARVGQFSLYCESWSGPSGVRTLGRVAHLAPEMERGIARHLVAEETLLGDDVVVAEIVHCPSHPARMANVTRRPRLRAHEIDCLGPSSADPATRIEVADLLLSVRDGRLRLRSRRFGREVVPRMTNAHSSAQPWHLPAYRMLCELQFDRGCGAQTWDWKPFAERAFLPRVTYGRSILSPATWLLARQSVPDMRESDDERLLATVEAWRRRWRLPRWVSVDDLVVDLAHPTMVRAGLRPRGGASTMRVKEFLPAELGTTAVGPEGSYVHELTVPFLNHGFRGTASTVRRATWVRHEVKQRQQVVFPPGSEWLQVNLFAGGQTLNSLLTGPLHETLAELVSAGAAGGWFFVRFGDPDRHLRLRLHGDPSRLLEQALPSLCHALEGHLRAGTVQRLQVDTYQSEVERYGGLLGVRLAEAVFCADSVAVVEMLRLDAGPVDATTQRAVLSLDRLLEDLGLVDLADRAHFTRAAHDALVAELGAAAVLHNEVGQRFRQQRDALERACLEPEGGALARVLPILARRSKSIRAVVAEVRRAIAADELSACIEQLAASHCHMHVNRLFHFPSRQSEMVLYGFLERIYAGRLAAHRVRTVRPLGDPFPCDAS